MSTTPRESMHAHAYRSQSFWDGVEECVETLDWNDFLEFANANALPIAASADFACALHERMRGLVRRLYQS
jgi:hypothetical protein